METSSRAALPMAKGFYDLGCCVTSVCGSKFAVGNLSRYTHNKVVVSGIDENPLIAKKEYERIFQEKKYDLVVPLSDFSAEIASRHKKEWESNFHFKIAVNEWDTFSNVIDKNKTMKLCIEHGIPAPKTLISNNLIEDLKSINFKYPVVVKPRTGVGSIGFHILKNEEEVILFLTSYDNSHGPLLVQEYIEQNGEPQYGAEMFRDHNGNIKAALVAKVVRWFPIDGGSRLCSIAIHNEDIINSCKELVDALNWNGYANIDLVWDAKEKKAKILELNGRTGASVKLDFLSGVNISELILENELGYDVSNMMYYKDGKMISCFLVDVLWFLKSKTRFTTKPSWFVRWKIKDVIFSWSDPLPSVGFAILSAKNFRREMKKRER